MNLFEMDSVFNFFDYVQGPEFVSGAYATYERILIKNSTSSEYENIEVKVLYKTNIFLTNDMVLHQRDCYTFFQLLSDFGGLCGMVFPLIVLINSRISYNIIMGELIGRLYYHIPPQYKVKNDLAYLTAYLFSEDRKNQVNNVRKMSFRFGELVYDTFLRPIFVCFRGSDHMKQVQLFTYMKRRLEDEIKLVNIVQR